MLVIFILISLLIPGRLWVDIRPSLDHGGEMAKRVQDVVLNSRTARMRLLPRHKPYFRLMADGVHLGYRRSTVPTRAGTWLVRRYRSEGQYETKLLAAADDTPDRVADGETILTFDQAQTVAREWARTQATIIRGEKALAKIESVRTAVVTYIAVRTTRAKKAGRDAELRLAHHVLSAPVADLDLLNLKEADLIKWREGLRRGGRGVKENALPIASATLARLLNDFRASLTLAARKAKAPADLLIQIKDGLRAPENHARAREKQVLSDVEVRRLVDASVALDDDFGALVIVLAATGCRFDQAARITVGDLQPEAGRVMVPTSKKGRGEKQTTHLAIPLPPDVIGLLVSLTAGRPSLSPLLLRWHHRQVTDHEKPGSLARWERAERRSWEDAAEMHRPWHAAVDAVGLSADLVPYCLRHSAIVRGLRAGLPVSLVAKAHDTSAAMIERHYGAFIIDASEDLLRRAVVPMMSVG